MEDVDPTYEFNAPKYHDFLIPDEQEDDAYFDNRCSVTPTPAVHIMTRFFKDPSTEPKAESTKELNSETPPPPEPECEETEEVLVSTFVDLSSKTSVPPSSTSRPPPTFNTPSSTKLRRFGMLGKALRTLTGTTTTSSAQMASRRLVRRAVRLGSSRTPEGSRMQSLSRKRPRQQDSSDTATTPRVQQLPKKICRQITPCAFRVKRIHTEEGTKENATPRTPSSQLVPKKARMTPRSAPPISRTKGIAPTLTTETRSKPPPCLPREERELEEVAKDLDRQKKEDLAMERKIQRVRKSTQQLPPLHPHTITRADPFRFETDARIHAQSTTCEEKRTEEIPKIGPLRAVHFDVGQPQKKIAKPFVFRTDERSYNRAQVAPNETPKPVLFETMLRSHASHGTTPLPCATTKPNMPRFHTEFRIQGRTTPRPETRNPSESVLEAAHKWNTGLRSETEAPPTTSAHPTLTKPDDITLATFKRARPSKELSFAEREAREMQMHPGFKANPFDPKIKEASGAQGLPRPRKAPLTDPRPPALRTERRSLNRTQRTPALDEACEAACKPFRASQIPKALFDHEPNLPEVETQKLTVPESPPLRTKRRSSAHKPEKKEEGVKYVFRANPAPPKPQPLVSVSGHAPPTRVDPFNLSSQQRHEAFLDTWRRKCGEEDEKARKAREFHAQPILQARKPPVIPHRPSITEQRPFQLESLKRHQVSLEQFDKKVQEEREGEQRARVFKARPMLVTDGAEVDFPRMSQPTITPNPFHLASSVRADQRDHFEQRRKEREREEASRKELMSGRENMYENALIKEMRKRTVHHALPMPSFPPPLSFKAHTVPTQAVSPNLATKYRRTTTEQ